MPKGVVSRSIVQTLVASMNHVLNGDTHGRHLANTMERSVLGRGDAGCR